MSNIRINVSFTLEIDRSDLPALLAVSAAKNISQARDFVKSEAVDYLVDYLSTNGARTTLKGEM